MTVKEIAKQTIDNLPNDAVLDDIIHALYIRSKVQNGVKEIHDGKGISNSDAKKRLKKWVK